MISVERIRAALCAMDHQEDSPDAILALGHEDAQNMAEFLSKELAKSEPGEIVEAFAVFVVDGHLHIETVQALRSDIVPTSTPGSTIIMSVSKPRKWQLVKVEEEDA